MTIEDYNAFTKVRSLETAQKLRQVIVTLEPEGLAGPPEVAFKVLSLMVHAGMKHLIDVARQDFPKESVAVMAIDLGLVAQIFALLADGRTFRTAGEVIDTMAREEQARLRRNAEDDQQDSAHQG